MKKFEIIKEFWDFLRSRRNWWLAVAAFFLLLIAGLIFMSQGSAVAPFIYTIF